MAPRMRQRTSGREKMPGKGFEELFWSLRRIRQEGCGQGPGHRETPEPAFLGSDDGVPASDNDWAPWVSS